MIKILQNRNSSKSTIISRNDDNKKKISYGNNISSIINLANIFSESELSSYNISNQEADSLNTSDNIMLVNLESILDEENLLFEELDYIQLPELDISANVENLFTDDQISFQVPLHELYLDNLNIFTPSSLSELLSRSLKNTKDLDINIFSHEIINIGVPKRSSLDSNILFLYHNDIANNTILNLKLEALDRSFFKFRETVIKKVRDNEVVTVHANAQKNIAGSRHYIHAEDVAEALLFLYNYDIAIDLNPGYQEAYNNRAATLQELGHVDEAINDYKKAISLKPDYTSAHVNLSAVLKSMERNEEALISIDKALALNPHLLEALNNKGAILKALGRLDEACNCYEKSLEIKPDYPEALTNLGNLHMERGQLEIALSKHEAAIAIKSNFSTAHENMGGTLYKMGRLKEAESALRLALKLNPDNRDPEFGLSITILSLGQLQEGWEKYESRVGHINIGWQNHESRKSLDRAATDFPQPQWDGSSLAGKRIILWGDQGLGDEIRFASIVPDLQKTEAIITIECDPRLTDIFARSFPDVNIFATPYTGAAEQPDQFDYQCPLAGLARFFRNDYEAFTKDKPGYLKADPALIKLWKKRLSDISDQPKIGLSWNSAVKERASHFASIEELAPILNIDGVDFVNLQSQDSSEDIAKAKEKFGIEIHSWDDLDNRNDLNGVAALTSCLDLVISFPCFSSELAGAIGVPTFCFVDHKDSFDELGSKDNIWYPNTHHISKDRNEQWTPVFKKIVEKTRSRLGL